MLRVYVYVLDTLADWEIGYVTSELNSARFFKKDAKCIVNTVSYSKEPIKTMGGLTVLPDCVIDDIIVGEESVLILPGANTWNDSSHCAILEKAGELLSFNATVCAICGATLALANVGILDNRFHTSNGLSFLEMFSPNYKGKDYYVDELSIKDNRLITAHTTGSLLWAKQIIEQLEVFDYDTLENWYKFFSTGEDRYFFALMNGLDK